MVIQKLLVIYNFIKMEHILLFLRQKRDPVVFILAEAVQEFLIKMEVIIIHLEQEEVGVLKVTVQLRQQPRLEMVEKDFNGSMILIKIIITAQEEALEQITVLK